VIIVISSLFNLSKIYHIGGKGVQSNLGYLLSLVGKSLMFR